MDSVTCIQRPGSPIVYLSTCGKSIFPAVDLQTKHQSVKWQVLAECPQKTRSKVPRIALRYPQVAPIRVDKGPYVVAKASLNEIEKCLPKNVREARAMRFCHGWYQTRKLNDFEKLLAVCHVTPNDAALAGETAALVYGIDMRESHRLGESYRICMVRPQGKRALRRPGIHCRTMDLSKGDVITYKGLRITSPLRTLVDLVRASTLDIGTHLIELFLKKGLVSRVMVEKAIACLAGFRGITTLRLAYRSVNVKSESPIETAVRLRLEEARLPSAQPQIPVMLPGETTPRRIDLGWVDAPVGPLGIEVQSVTFHPTSGLKFESDRRRKQALESLGWRILEVRTADLRGKKKTFENQVAHLLGMSIPQGERKYWGPSQWDRKHNKWRQEPQRLWPAYRETCGEARVNLT